MDNYDFSGWATRTNIKCADGRTIMKDAFKDCDGKTVPLVWGHNHTNPEYVLGHALLENRDNGVYMYGSLNESETANLAREFIKHGDITSLSIYANRLKQNGGNVVHGMIREVSLVLAGANPEAYIDSVMIHEEGSDEEAIIYSGEAEGIELHHADTKDKEDKKETTEDTTKSEQEGDKMADNTKETAAPAENKESEGKTIQEIYDSMTKEQQDVVAIIVGQALEDAKGGTSDDEGDDNVKHNVFDYDEQTEYLSHDDMAEIISDAKRYGSLKDAVLQHGIDQIDWLFPEPTNLDKTPQFIQRDTGWVAKVMGGVHHSPMSRIKSQFANITEDDARAKGYIKGNMKKDEVFGLLKRTTTPTTIYKKQKLDRDDVVDITDFDVVAWLKAEMRMMLDEELARAFLIGDGRSSSSDDKINEQNIRPILSDDDLFTIKAAVNVSSSATDSDKAKAFIKAAIKARKDYKGSGEPTLYCSEDILTDMLLIEDTTGRVIYDSMAKLTAQLRVKEIVTVPLMEGLTNSDSKTVYGIIVNLSDYNVGADKGGEVNMFDDFDIDYNAQKYLIETRCSGALVKPFSAIALYEETVSG